MTAPVSQVLSEAEVRAPDRNTLIALARMWWEQHMPDSHYKSAQITGDGRVNVYWQDAAESGRYTLPVDYPAAALAKDHGK